MDYAKQQLAVALRTLPWYVGVPSLLVLPLGAAFYLSGSDAKWMWSTIEIAACCGLFVWAIRQSVRVLWTVRQLTR